MRLLLSVLVLAPGTGFGHWGTQYDISPDGSRIYFMQPTQAAAPTEVQVAINWPSLLTSSGEASGD